MLHLFAIHQRHGRALRTGATGAADAMDVVFRHVGQFEVHHLRQLVDIQPACGDIGRHQHLQLATLEIGQCPGAGALALVAVDRGGTDALPGQLFGQAVGAVLGPREHQHLEPLAGLDEVAQQVALVLLRHQMHALLDQLGGGVAAGHLDITWPMQQAVGELTDLVREGRGEQQVLALPRKQCEHLADVADESHVEHAIGLVEHQDLDAGEIDVALADVVEQASGGGHQDVHWLAQGLDLGFDADAAEHHHAGDRQMASVGVHRLLDLGRQLAGRGQDQAAGATRLRLARAVGETVQDRQREAGGLASAGLGCGQQVAAVQHQGDGLRLDRRRRAVAGFGHGAQQGIGQPEAGKALFDVHSKSPATTCRSFE